MASVNTSAGTPIAISISHNACNNPHALIILWQAATTFTDMIHSVKGGRGGEGTHAICNNIRNSVLTCAGALGATNARITCTIQ